MLTGLPTDQFTRPLAERLTDSLTDGLTLIDRLTD